ncbi:ComEC/Rec2 family competence protein [Winogradskyella arenosi]|uniref:Competence protein ComEC n=1 Tax=Winogradskyella arenosi TaxID=533325 RepID=A0A368ZBS7_9FLAO|nr:ComEC/Rec2 family competence protein [Winogradskyella arenosi]RCW90313.1 competence protein ComEC [Winogradskyella arenosi]
MKLLNFIVIKLTLCLVTGILVAHYFTLDTNLIIYISIGLTLSLLVYNFLISKLIYSPITFGILSYCCMLSLGMTSYHIQDEKRHPSHYSHLELSDSPETLIFQIKARLKPDRYNDKYIVSLKSVNTHKVTGQLLLNIRRDTLIKPINVDDVFATQARLQNTASPKNPYQFDYGKYLAFQHVHHQIYVQTSELLPLYNSKRTLYGYADALRVHINSKLVTAGFKDDVLSIMNALLLGQRQNIDKTLYNSYVNSGTIHILAVSGLHIGILLYLLNFLFSPLLFLKYGHFIRPFLLILILWSFAIIAGLSPSVTRAVTMFSVISIAMHLKRRTNIYNTLVTSAFFTLLFQPNFLFAVGFQMSYLAVLGIVTLQPKLYALWIPKFYIPRKLWEIITVTIAAQLGVLPISLFYFHQFPGLFFISNLVVIPFLGLILGLGIFIIALALINLLIEEIVITYSFVIDSLNSFIAWVAQFESFLLKDISFSLFQLVWCYALLVSITQALRTYRYKWVVLSLILVIGGQSKALYQTLQSPTESFIIFNQSRHTVIGNHKDQTLAVYHNLEPDQQRNHTTIRNYKVGEGIKDVTFHKLQPVYQYNDKTLLVIDSLGVYNKLSFAPDYIVLRDSPRLNLNRLIDQLNPKLIIADASNYKTYVERWKLTCRHKKIPFHYTNEKGAFIINSAAIIP